jgi:hypothetical protein
MVANRKFIPTNLKRRSIICGSAAKGRPIASAGSTQTHLRVCRDLSA